MASSRDAFLRFSKWKKDRTLLSFTEIAPDGASNTVNGDIYHEDRESGILGFIVVPGKERRELDLSEASFDVGPRSVTASIRSLGEFVIEEVLPQ